MDKPKGQHFKEVKDVKHEPTWVEGRYETFLNGQVILRGRQPFLVDRTWQKRGKFLIQKEGNSVTKLQPAL